MPDRIRRRPGGRPILANPLPVFIEADQRLAVLLNGLIVRHVVGIGVHLALGRRIRRQAQGHGSPRRCDRGRGAVSGILVLVQGLCQQLCGEGRLRRCGGQLLVFGVHGRDLGGRRRIGGAGPARTIVIGARIVAFVGGEPLLQIGIVPAAAGGRRREAHLEGVGRRSWRGGAGVRLNERWPRVDVLGLLFRHQPGLDRGAAGDGRHLGGTPVLEAGLFEVAPRLVQPALDLHGRGASTGLKGHAPGDQLAQQILARFFAHALCRAGHHRGMPFGLGGGIGGRRPGDQLREDRAKGVDIAGVSVHPPLALGRGPGCGKGQPGPGRVALTRPIGGFDPQANQAQLTRGANPDVIGGQIAVNQPVGDIGAGGHAIPCSMQGPRQLAGDLAGHGRGQLPAQEHRRQ